MMDILYYYSLLLALLLCLFVRQQARGRNPGSKLPPGPWQLPVLGSMHHLIRRGLIPHHRLADMARTYGPIMHLKLGEISTFVVSSAEIASEILKTHDVCFAERPQMTVLYNLMYRGKDLVMAPYGSYWRQMRKICVLELLSAKRVQSFRSIREEEASRLICSIRSSSPSPINLTKLLASFSNDVITRSAFGKQCKDKGTFLAALEEFEALSSCFCLADIYPSWGFLGTATGLKPRSMRLHQKIDRILDNIIRDHEERKTTPSSEALEEDLVDILLRLEEHGGLEFPLTTDHVKAIIFDNFAGGTQTSSTLMDWIMSELVRNPRVMERAQAEVREVLKGKEKVTEEEIQALDYLRLVIKETLRLHPPFPLLTPRVCREACEVRGYKVPEKAWVLVNAWALGRDTRHWEEADVFKPERFEGSSLDFKGANFEFIPFGGGRRMCPGILFGLATAEIALAQLLYHFDWKLPHGMEPCDLDMTETAGNFCTRMSNLCLSASPFVPSLVA